MLYSWFWKKRISLYGEACYVIKSPLDASSSLSLKVLGESQIHRTPSFCHHLLFRNVIYLPVIFFFFFASSLFHCCPAFASLLSVLSSRPPVFEDLLCVQVSHCVSLIPKACTSKIAAATPGACSNSQCQVIMPGLYYSQYLRAGVRRALPSSCACHSRASSP